MLNCIRVSNETRKTNKQTNNLHALEAISKKEGRDRKKERKKGREKKKEREITDKSEGRINLF